MDFARAFSYIFEDSDWLKKVGIAALVLLIPVLGVITVFGWSLTVTKRLIEGQTTNLHPARSQDRAIPRCHHFRASVIPKPVVSGIIHPLTNAGPDAN